MPGDAAAGESFARFRVSSTGGLGVTGLASDCEVEDYIVNLDGIPDDASIGDFIWSDINEDGVHDEGARWRESLDLGADLRKQGGLVAHVADDRAGRCGGAHAFSRRSRRSTSESMRPEYQFRAVVSDREPRA